MEQVLYPVVVISRLFGVGIATPRNQLTFVHAIYYLIVSVVLIYCTIYSIIYLNEIEGIYSSILRITLDRFEYLLNSFTAAFSILCSFLSRAQTMQVIANLEFIDDYLKKSGAQVCYNKMQYLSGSLLRLLLLVTGMMLEHFWIRNVSNLNNLMFFVCQFLPYFVSHYTEYQHNVILNTIQKRLNILIERLITIKSRQMSFNKQAELESLVKMSNYLVESCGLINEIYGKMILLIVGNIFILTTSNSDYVVEGIIELVLNKSTKNIENLFTAGYWAAIRLMELWNVVQACENVVQKVKDFSSVLYQYMIEESDEVCKNKKIRLHLTVQKEPYFSAHGFFSLDFTLLHSMIATATTYLIILIQFSQAGSSGTRIQPSFNVTTSEPTSKLFEEKEYSNSTI